MLQTDMYMQWYALPYSSLFQVFQQQLISMGYSKGCWHHQHNENIEDYIEAGNTEGELFLFSRNAEDVKPTYWGFLRMYLVCIHCKPD